MVHNQELTAARSCLPALYNALTCVTACIDIAPTVSSNSCIWPPVKRGLLHETLGEANTDMADTSGKPLTPVRHLAWASGKHLPQLRLDPYAPSLGWQAWFCRVATLQSLFHVLASRNTFAAIIMIVIIVVETRILAFLQVKAHPAQHWCWLPPFHLQSLPPFT